jgi:cyclomaltodextrinase/neopullulanase
MQIGEYWLKQGIDGWRLDVPFEVKTQGFWQEFRDRVKGINPEAYIVGEVWGDSREWLDGTQFDGVMNYLFTSPTIAFTTGDRVIKELVQDRDYYPYPAIDAKDYAQQIQDLLQLYPWEIQLTQLNILASHDTARLMSIADRDRDSVKLATLLQMTFPGAPSIYYGDEIGLLGGLDPDARRGFPMEKDWDLDIYDCHKSLIALRHAHAALRTGTYQVLFAQDSLYVFARILGAAELIIAVNTGTETTSASVATSQIKSQPSQILYGNAQVSWQSQQDIPTLDLTLPARTGCILG